MIDPGGQRVAIAADLGDREFSTPTVIRKREHVRFGPCRIFFIAVTQQAAQHIMPLGEGIGFNHDPVALNPFDREPPAIDFRLYVLDYGPSAALVKRYHRHGFDPSYLSALK